MIQLKAYLTAITTITYLLIDLTTAQGQTPWQCGASQLEPATPLQCPAWAPISCNSIGAPDYCCPDGTFCSWGYSTNGQAGCCPNGAKCAGSQPNTITTTTWVPLTTTTTWVPPPSSSTYWTPPPSSTTYWVPPPSSTTYWTPSPSTTPYWQPTTTPCGCESDRTTIYVQPSTVYVQPSPTTNAQVTTVTIQSYPNKATTTTANLGLGIYCSTETAFGPGLPTTARGLCGTILVVAGAPRLDPSLGTKLLMACLTVPLVILLLL